MGELASLYEVADIVFIGGTFAPLGGHNFLEACIWKKPVIVGPHTRNVESDVAHFLAADALRQVDDSEAFRNTIVELLEAPERASAIGAKAHEVILEQRGATETIVDHVSATLGWKRDLA
jgi:3-deoxy-D-manno-octulosonic-acid transferase